MDEGCARAIEGGASLLAAGITEVTGEFKRGDLVTVVSAKGDRVAQGLSEYSAAECRAIMGARQEAQGPKLGYTPRAAVIHRDHLVRLWISLTGATVSCRRCSRGRGGASRPGDHPRKGAAPGGPDRGSLNDPASLGRWSGGRPSSSCWPHNRARCRPVCHCN